MREAVSTSAAPAAIGPYSQAVRAGSLVFVSGQIPLDPATGTMVDGDIAVQTHRVFRNLAGILEAAGSSLDRVVRATVYLADMNDFAAMNEVYAELLSARRPRRVRRSRPLGCPRTRASKSTSSPKSELRLRRTPKLQLPSSSKHQRSTPKPGAKPKPRLGLDLGVGSALAFGRWQLIVDRERVLNSPRARHPAHLRRSAAT